MGCGGNQDLAQADLLGLIKVFLMVGVELLDFGLGDLDPRTDLVANHLLGNDLVAHVLLEIFPIHALLLSGLLQVFNRFQVHLLAHFIQALDHVGISGDPQVFPFLHQKGLINQVAQHVFLLGGKHLLGLRPILVFEFILDLGMAALEF